MAGKVNIRWAGVARPLLFGAVLGLSGCADASSGASVPTERSGPELVVPVACTVGQSCAIQNYMDRDPGPEVRDYACKGRTYQDHNGLDIRVPDLAAQRNGVQVLAAAPGVVSRLRDGVPDVSVKTTGLGAVEGMECGNGVVIDHGEGWETQYCHLAQGSVMVAQGAQVQAGQPIAQIGLSGQTEYPHLHFTVRRNGVVVDPFAPDAGETRTCEAQAPLWSAAAQQALAYQEGAVLNTGFSAGAVTMEAVEEANITAAAANAPALVAYVRAIALEGGDVQHLKMTGPNGATIAENTIDPLDRAKAQYLLYAGARTPTEGWAPGTYRAEYWVERKGARVLEKTFETRF